MGFRALRPRFVAEQPYRFWLDVPVQNIRKALFKSTLAKAPVLENRAVPPQAGLMRLVVRLPHRAATAGVGASSWECGGSQSWGW